MDTRIPPIRTDVVAATTAPRPTATPVRVKFSEVLAGGARGLVAGAETAMKNLPGAPLMAVAIRGGGPSAGFAGRTSLGSTGLLGGVGGAGMGGAHALGGAASTSPEGPGATGAAGAAGGTGADAGVEGSLAQSQEMNMYYLQIQEQVNAENRTFSTLSNVLKAEHDTVKTAIGNIR